MIEVTKYIAYDGTEFDDEEKCLEHERDQRYWGVIARNELEMWDSDYEPTKDISFMMYFRCKTDLSFDYLRELHDYDGVLGCPDSVELGELYIFDEQEQKYVSFKDYSKHVFEIMRKFHLMAIE